MSFKTTYVLFGILGAMLVVFALVLWFVPTTIPDKAFILPSAHSESKGKVGPDDVDRVVLERREPVEETLVFERVGEGKERQWRMKQPVDAAVDRFAVDTLARQVLEARKDETADLTKDLKQWGLDKPEAVLTVEA